MAADIDEIVARIGKAQRRTILSLSDQWGPADSHAAAKRLWYRDDIPRLVDHRHCTDNCWSLTRSGQAVRARLLEGGGDA